MDGAREVESECAVTGACFENFEVRRGRRGGRVGDGGVEVEEGDD